ncbi:hypothetical protein [Amycolatopsis sp. CA-128772]|uniref:hypothetical protein n=1 Tax=Amycolatopsis sp. CA-128772 TaxID=2073159 RepID=UPI000CCFDA5A|nr:hypothetical protein [Amycolatopsis sp. CA-128772]
MAEDPRPYIRVHIGMPDHPKVEVLSDRAYRVITALWCWCADKRTDGVVRRPNWRKRGLTQRIRDELVSAALLEVVDADTIQVHDYLDWQQSAEQIADAIAQKRSAGGLGGHKRWHAGAGRFDPTCVHCVRERSRAPSHPPLHPPSRSGSRIDSGDMPDIEGEVEEEEGGALDGDLTSARRARAEPPATGPPADRCPQHRDVAGAVPPCGACADARKAAERHDVEQAARARACPLCDGDGFRYVPGRRIPITPYEKCDHLPREERRA